MDWTWIPGYPWPEWIAQVGSGLMVGVWIYLVGKALFDDWEK